MNNFAVQVTGVVGPGIAAGRHLQGHRVRACGKILNELCDAVCKGKKC
jgi:hypothetical protein